MDQTCFGRTSGFAPTTIPYSLIDDFDKFETSMMLTSSASEGGHQAN
jgi:hypothetical protein